MSKRITNTWELLVELRKLNPVVNFQTDANVTYLSIDWPPESLILPKPFSYDEKDGITNKHAAYGNNIIAIPVW